MDLKEFLDVGFIFLLVPLIAFILLYASTAPWWKTAIGRIIMIQKISWILYICLVIIAREYKVEEWYEPLRLVVYTLLTIGFWSMLFQLAKTQMKNWRNRGSQSKPND